MLPSLPKFEQWQVVRQEVDALIAELGRLSYDPSKDHRELFDRFAEKRAMEKLLFEQAMNEIRQAAESLRVSYEDSSVRQEHNQPGT